MKKKQLSVIAFLAGAIIAGGSLYSYKASRENGLVAKVADLERASTTQMNELLGYTKYSDYITAGKKTLQDQMKFLAAKVVREEGFTRVINKKILGLSSDATVAVWYTAEYSFGYDLQPNSYDVTTTAKGINIRLKKPVMVASPAVKSLRHKVLSGGVLTDEKAAVINLYEGLEKQTMANGLAISSEEAVTALCEKKLISFFRDFLSKQPGVKTIPDITVSYKG